MEHYKPKHFGAYEFLPPDVFDVFGDRGMYLLMDVRVLITADQIREFFGVPFTANNWKWKKSGGFRYRGYRPDKYYHNQQTDPNKSGSQHRFGRALDGDLKGITATEARDVIMNHQDRFPYITRIEDSVNWLHFDVANIFHRGIHLFDP